jgi:hypothetical protein
MYTTFSNSLSSLAVSSSHPAAHHTLPDLHMHVLSPPHADTPHADYPYLFSITIVLVVQETKTIAVSLLTLMLQMNTKAHFRAAWLTCRSASRLDVTE